MSRSSTAILADCQLASFPTTEDILTRLAPECNPPAKHGFEIETADRGVALASRGGFLWDPGANGEWFFIGLPIVLG